MVTGHLNLSSLWLLKTRAIAPDSKMVATTAQLLFGICVWRALLQVFPSSKEKLEKIEDDQKNTVYEMISKVRVLTRP